MFRSFPSEEFARDPFENRIFNNVLISIFSSDEKTKSNGINAKYNQIFTHSQQFPLGISVKLPRYKKINLKFYVYGGTFREI